MKKSATTGNKTIVYSPTLRELRRLIHGKGLRTLREVLRRDKTTMLIQLP